MRLSYAKPCTARDHGRRPQRKPPLSKIIINNNPRCDNCLERVQRFHLLNLKHGFILSCVCLQVAQTFYITIKPVDDSLPLLQVPGMRVQEGVRKTITEFELKVTDADTEVTHKSLKI